MGVYIEMPPYRWAVEPVGSDTLARFDRVPGTPDRPSRRAWGNGAFATYWKLKGSV